MKNKYSDSNSIFPSTILFLAGFLSGMILPNLGWKNTIVKNTLSSAFFLSALEKEISWGRGLWFIICKERGIFLFLAILSGFTVFGVPFAILAIFLLGFWTSALLTISILQLGLWGMLICFGMLLPQSLFYYPAIFLLSEHIYSESRLIWKRKGALPEKMTEYALCILFVFILVLAGSLLEAYCNPEFLRFLFRYLPLL